MNDETILRVLKKIGRSPEEQVKVRLRSLAIYTYTFYRRIKEVDPEGFERVFLSLWLKWLDDYFNEVKESSDPRNMLK